jgi:hypothetical protein
MHTSIPERFCWPTLPLAVYREISAHLQQIEGVTVHLFPQSSSQFDYELSQVGGIQLSLAHDLNDTAREKIGEILQYYRLRFGDWQNC